MTAKKTQQINYRDIKKVVVTKNNNAGLFPGPVTLNPGNMDEQV